jgi:pyridoxal phosphate enzyme (YggS family)
MPGIDENLKAVRQRMDAVGRKHGRSPQALVLVAVSKTCPAQAVSAAYAAGQRDFGENYVQEGIEKITALMGLQGIVWHFIGPLQSNKTRPVAENFAWVHSVDRLKIAQRLSEQRPAEAAPLNVCLQVNVSGEASKSGISPDEVLSLAQAVAALPRLCLRGLMCIPEPSEDAAVLAARFGTLAHLQQVLHKAGLMVDTLSMGMSADMEPAIAAGATMVRVGSAIFGARPAKPV